MMLQNALQALQKAAALFPLVSRLLLCETACKLDETSLIWRNFHLDVVRIRLHASIHCYPCGGTQLNKAAVQATNRACAQSSGGRLQS